jgi:hypothetical protein
MAECTLDMSGTGWRAGGAAALLAAALPVAALAGGSRPAAAAVPPAANPAIAESCGVDVTLVLDASGSIQSSNAVDDVRDAAEAFLDALRNTNSTARVTQFATVSAQLASRTLVVDSSLAPGGALAGALAGYYNPKPPRPAGVDFYEYRGGNPQSASSFRLRNDGTDQYTNWDQGLRDARGGGPAELVVFVTDGDPTAYDLDQPGDPFSPGPPPDVAFNTGTDQAAQVTLDRAVVEANQIKANTRMLTIGVGSALGNSSSVSRLVAVTGPQVVRDADLASITSINQIDVALVEDFDDLAQVLRGVVLQLCSPSLTVRKFAQSPTDADFAPAPGWAITATPTAPGGSFRWILPNTTPATSKTLATDANGFAQFQWEPIPPELDSRAVVREALQPGFRPGRDGENDFRCELRDQNGRVRVVEGELAADLSFTLDPIGQEIVTCSVWNSFIYQPAIAITKANAPVVVRGDLVPGTAVTSSYVVTNPGNTPLRNVTMIDDRCGPVRGVPQTGPNVGDTNRDLRLDTTEQWQYTCVRDSVTQTIDNTATVTATDPAGTTVTSQATATVTAFNPGIDLTKLVNGQEEVTVPVGANLSYTYRAQNTGDMPLGTVVLQDDTPPCGSPTRGPDSPGNNDAILDVGEAWTFSCAATSSADVINTAAVTATPLNPLGGNQPFPDPNPQVTATDVASVRVVTPGIGLTKAATPDLVVIEPGAPPEPVTYDFVATNSGNVPLNRPGATTGGPAATGPGWITDPHCTSPSTYVSGDANGNVLLDPGETWRFTCPGAVSEPTLNTATIVGQPSNAQGAPLPGIPTVSAEAQAFVDVAFPAIAVVKTAIRGVVVDDDATPVRGPDMPPRPAEYLYEVTNTGTVPLSLAANPPVDDVCSPVTFVEGDEDGNNLLDVDETWSYTCTTPLDRTDDSNTPPVTGRESGLVTNSVNVTGVPFVEQALVPDRAVSATDRAQVTVIEPGITITKAPSAPVVLVGSDVTYTFSVANTGDVGLDVVGPTDDKCSPLTFTGGDRNGNGLLEGANSGQAELWRYQCTRAVGMPTAPATADENEASVEGIDPLGNVYAAETTATVRVFDPAIELEKTVSDSLVLAGTEVTYDFEVTNAGVSPVPADDVLADIVLADGSDPPVPSCTSPTFVGGDTNGDQLLQRVPAEVWLYRCNAIINEATTNLAEVRGTGGTQLTPPAPVSVSDPAAAFVQAFHPAIEVAKTATPTEILKGGQVVYAYEVRNTGDVPLADVAARITDDTCSPVTYVSGDEDGDNLLDTPNSIFEDSLDETWTFACTATVNETTTNTVTVTGTPTDPGGEPLCPTEPCDATDTDNATVTALDPGTIVIEKATTTATSTTFGFTFGDTDFELASGESKTFENLAPGSYTVTEDLPGDWLLQGIRCVDPTNDSVVGIATTQAEIEVASGETVTCTFTNWMPTLPATGLSLLEWLLAIVALCSGLAGISILVTGGRLARH